MDPRDALETLPRETALVVGLVSGSHVVNHLYLLLFPPILATLAGDFDVGIGALGVAMGVQALVNTALQLPYGYLSDAYDRVLTLALCLGLGALGAGILAVAPSYEVLLLGQAVLGAGVAGHHSAHFPLLSDATSASRRGAAYSAHGFAGNLGFAAPPVVILGVTALPGTSWRHAFGLIAVVGAVYGVVACTVLGRYVSDDITRPNADATDERRRGDDTAGGRIWAELRALADAGPILGLGVVSMLASTAFWGVSSYLVVFLTEGYGLADELASLSLTAMFVVGAGLILVGGVLADRFRPGTILAAAYGLVALAVFGLAAAVAPPVVALGVGILAGSLGSLGLPARDKLADRLSARRDIGRNFAVVTIGIMVGNTVAPPVFGALIETVGYRPTFGLVGVAALCASAATVAIVTRYGDASEPEPTVVAGE
jgi:predicted MFS family arabinose efflux permease